MMKPLVFIAPEQKDLGEEIIRLSGAEPAVYTQRPFPDGETYTRVFSDVRGRVCVLISCLAPPDNAFLPLYFLCSLLRDMGSGRIILVAPYLPYLRQDKAFQEGEAVSSVYFARCVSGICDELVTIDPHLHRITDLKVVYDIPCVVLETAGLIAGFINDRFAQPLLIGPDEESEQWVSRIAMLSAAPYCMLKKQRLGDRLVKMDADIPPEYIQYTPVITDDIISSGTTVMEAARHIRQAGMKTPACAVIHPLFAGDAFQKLQAGGIDVYSCNTIPHVSNRMDIAPLVAEYIKGIS